MKKFFLISAIAFSIAACNDDYSSTKSSAESADDTSANRDGNAADNTNNTVLPDTMRMDTAGNINGNTSGNRVSNDTSASR